MGRHMYCTDWGDFEIPDDVPRLFRVDGWFDRRFKLATDLQQYFLDMGERIRDDKPIQTWAEWKA